MLQQHKAHQLNCSSVRNRLIQLNTIQYCAIIAVGCSEVVCSVYNIVQVYLQCILLSTRYLCCCWAVCLQQRYKLKWEQEHRANIEAILGVWVVKNVIYIKSVYYLLVCMARPFLRWWLKKKTLHIWLEKLSTLRYNRLKKSWLSHSDPSRPWREDWKTIGDWTMNLKNSSTVLLFSP